MPATRERGEWPRLGLSLSKAKPRTEGSGASGRSPSSGGRHRAERTPSIIHRVGISTGRSRDGTRGEVVRRCADALLASGPVRRRHGPVWTAQRAGPGHGQERQGNITLYVPARGCHGKAPRRITARVMRCGDGDDTRRGLHVFAAVGFRRCGVWRHSGATPRGLALRGGRVGPRHHRTRRVRRERSSAPRGGFGQTAWPELGEGEAGRGGACHAAEVVRMGAWRARCARSLREQAGVVSAGTHRFGSSTTAAVPAQHSPRVAPRVSAGGEHGR